VPQRTYKARMSWPVGAQQPCTHNAQCNAENAEHFIIVCALRQSHLYSSLL